MLFWEVVEPLGGEDQLAQTGHQGQAFQGYTTPLFQFLAHCNSRSVLYPTAATHPPASVVWNHPDTVSFASFDCFCQVSAHSNSKRLQKAADHFPVVPHPKFQLIYLPWSLLEFSMMFPASAILRHFLICFSRVTLYHLFSGWTSHHLLSPVYTQSSRAGRVTSSPGIHITLYTCSCLVDTGRISCIVISEMSRARAHASTEKRSTTDLRANTISTYHLPSRITKF